MAEARYKSIHTGAKIDEAVSSILSGQFGQYAASAANSAASAGNSATSAANSAGVASSSATNAASSATSASNSATNAANSAGTAAAHASNAATSAANAANSATSAATNATSASNSERNAANSAASAGNSATSAEKSAESAKKYSGNPPKPINGTWWIWNAATDSYIDTEIPYVLTPNQSYPSVAAMEADFGNTRRNDVAMINGSTEKEDTGKVFINNGSEWFYLSDLSGPRGQKGEPGETGATGPQGEPGKNGVAVAVSGQVAFNINEDGYLILSYPDGEQPPNYQIKEDGCLYLTIE